MNRPLPAPVLFLVGWVGLLGLLCFGYHPVDLKGDYLGMYEETAAFAPLAAVGLKTPVPAAGSGVTYAPSVVGFLGWVAAGAVVAWLWGRKRRG